MTRGKAIFRVSRKLGLDDTTGSDERILMEDWFNDGIVDVLLRTHIFIQLGDAALTAGVAEYRLDTAILAIDDGRGSTPSGIGHYHLVSLSEIIDYQAAGITSPTYRKLIAIEGDLMIVAPTPAANESLRFFHVPRPSATTDDSHDPSLAAYGGIPTEAHRAIEYYMLWQGAEYDDKESKKSAEYLLDYDRECVRVRKEKRQKRSRGLLPARVGYPEARALKRRNDSYP